MKGKIIKGIAGFYYVDTGDGDVYECKAKGAFRKESVKPLVGDNVDMDIISEEKHTANIVSILKRENELFRPEVANIDQAMIIFATAEPEPNLNLLDRFLVMMRKQNVDTTIVFNKTDQVSQEELERLLAVYEKSGNKVLTLSVRQHEGIDVLMNELAGKTTVLAGPSGVGKSSIMNAVGRADIMETGGLSEKLQRGKNTTRHSQLERIAKDTYLCDTPGFSSLFVKDIEPSALKAYFPEFEPFEPECRFLSCVHMKEPECGVKNAVAEGLIHKSRYENYAYLYEELRTQKKY